VANGAILDAATGRRVGSVRADGPITAATSDGHGGWFIAGAFGQVDGIGRRTLAHVHADGALDRAWRGPELGAPSAVMYLSVARAAGRVMVAGAFRSADGRRVPGLVAVDERSGAQDLTWRRLSLCADGMALVEASEGRTFVATACAAPPCLLQVGSRTGALVTEWSAHIDAIGEVGCVEGLDAANGIVAFTGGFTAVGGVARNGVAVVDAKTGSVLGFAPSGRCAGFGHAVEVGRGMLFVAGDVCPVAAFHLRGGEEAWSVPRRGNATSTTLATYADRVYVGGSFDRLSGRVANGLAAFDATTGRPLPSWHPDVPTELSSLSLSGSRILVGTF
jgi:trimeric autotransporter adhesin